MTLTNLTIQVTAWGWAGPNYKSRTVEEDSKANLASEPNLSTSRQNINFKKNLVIALSNIN